MVLKVMVANVVSPDAELSSFTSPTIIDAEVIASTYGRVPENLSRT
jgi:hypothetical protein